MNTKLYLAAVLIVLTGCASLKTSKNSDFQDSEEDRSVKGEIFDDKRMEQGEASTPKLNMPKEIAEARPARSVDKKYQPLSAALRSGQHDAVVAEASKVLATNGSDPVALNAVAMSLYRQGRLGAAKFLLDKAFEKNQKEGSLLNNLALIQIAEGDTAGALLTFKRAYRLNDSNPEIQGNLGSLYVQGGDYTRALPLLENAFSANKNSASIANNYAIALRATNNLSRAEKIYTELIKQNPRDVTLHLNYAILLVEFLNKPKEGLAMATKVKFLESERKDVLDRANELEKKARSGLK
jgi:Flp pilus assembly protein TadD